MIKPRTLAKLDGKAVLQATLENAYHQVKILNYGCIVKDWQVVHSSGKKQSVILGLDRVEDYVAHSPNFGAIVGRVANRIAHSQFELDGKTYHLPANLGQHHLHGGSPGLAQRLWNMAFDSQNNAVELTYLSPDGEQGYPGNVAFTVLMRLTDAGLQIKMSGQPDQPTPINLAQHNYYNLGHSATARDHQLRILASSYTATDDHLIPTGEILSVAGTAYDFRQARSPNMADPESRGYDVNLVLNHDRASNEAAASLSCADSNLQLQVFTDQPGLQVFDAHTITTPVGGPAGNGYQAFCGLCLEAQQFPDAVNQATFPSIICTPDAPYSQRLALNITDINAS